MTAVIGLACPKRAGGGDHEWASVHEDLERSCVHCGRHGREKEEPGQPNGGFFAEATAARAELFSGLRAPASVKAWGKS